jgi:hypothetical protein
MKQGYSFLISPLGKQYQYNFPAICTYCGRPAGEAAKIVLDERLGLVRSTVSIKIPYCGEHMELIRKFTWIKNGIYCISFVITVLVLLLAGLQQIVLLGVAAVLAWSAVVFPLFKYLLIKPLLRIVDERRIFESDTNTLSFAARLELGGLVLCFADAAIAEQFANANSNNPQVKRLQGSVISTVLSG